MFRTTDAKKFRSQGRVEVSLGCLAFVFAVCFGTSTAWGQTAAISADVLSLQHLIDQYAVSIDNADTALAAQVWSQSPEASFIHPRGHEHGFDQVKQNFYVQTDGREVFQAEAQHRMS